MGDGGFESWEAGILLGNKGVQGTGLGRQVPLGGMNRTLVVFRT